MRLDVVLRALGVARSVFGVVGKYRTAQHIGLAVAIGWFLYTALGADFLASAGDADPVSRFFTDAGAGTRRD